MIYQYLDLQGRTDTKTSTYPLIYVILVYKHQLIKTPIPGLVDSGSQHCYCHMTIGEYLRIDFKKKKPITSTAANGSKFKGFLETITFIINSTRVDSPVIFSREMNPNFPLVLGQQGFFSNFQVCFNKSKNGFTLD